MERKRASACGKKLPALVLAGLVALTASACDSNSVAPQMSKVQILLTDAPSDMLDSAHVWISHVYLQGGGGTEPDTAASDTTSTDTAGRVDLYNDSENPLTFDLLTLRNGLTADVTEQMDIPADTYQGLRFVVDSARVSLAEGYAFADGSTTGVLMVPSGSQSGIKVKLSDVILANEGEATTVTVDFDVDANFVIQQDAQSGVVNKILFTPVLKEKTRQTSPS